MTITKCHYHQWACQYKYTKKYKRGTWAYNTFDGWYLATPTEQYLTHRCHIKSTSNERFTYTIKFSLRKLTQTTIIHAEKLMEAIEDCAKAIKNLSNGNGFEEMKQRINITERAIQHKKYIVKTPTTTTFEPERSRVPLNTKNNNTHQTRSTTQPTQKLPTTSTPSVPRVEQSTITKY